ncbi:hypothetical protein [Methylobacterium sp. J-070]|uniref:hypothetical protein n=1 Tax=Methylobacterium sp. J-070 TaxID=2836650 RepID=UPI001FB88647|nr:hypothetical protein [Methylobacterium sp. J-070]MCJ2051670.1 hypothetical protein [Methylobacterium sp. J-070]
MVAYSFKSRFAAPILAGTKAQTIRAERAGKSRHARPGELVQLYTGMRTRQCRRLGEAWCLEVLPIRLCFSRHGMAELVQFGDRFIRPERTDDFAREDGFVDAEDMARFWWAEHGSAPRSDDRFTDPDTLIFEGVLIRWQPLAPASELDMAGVAA